MRVERTPATRRDAERVGQPGGASPGDGVGRPAQVGDLLLEVLDRGERAVDAGEAHVGDLVQLAQRAEDGEADLVAGDLGGAAGADGLLHPVRELRQRVFVDRASLARPPDAAHDLVAAERLGDPAALHHREHGLLDGGEPPTAGGAGAPAPDGLAVVHLAGVDDPAVAVPAERATHGLPPSRVTTPA